jgi:aspartate aminotransferase
MTDTKLSRRGASAPASPIRRLTPHADYAKSLGRAVHHLNIGQPDLPPPPEVFDIGHYLEPEAFEYSPSNGLASFRAALADDLRRVELHGNEPLGADDIIVTAGGSEALLLTLAAICDPGDQIVVADPFYANYHGFANMLGIELKHFRRHLHDGFRIHPREVAELIGPRTRAVLVCTPDNPTGAVIDRPTLLELGAICRDAGIYLISDEVYRDFVYPEEGAGGGALAPSVIGLPGLERHAVLIDSMSKRFSVCGVRVGFLATRNAELREAALRFAQARLSPPGIGQRACLVALRASEEWRRASVAEYRKRRDLLVAGLNAIDGVSAPCPGGAFYLVVDLPVEDAEDFCIFLLRDFHLDGETVMLAPASGFYAEPDACAHRVRIAYVLSVPKLERCLQIIEAGLAAYRAR